LQKRDKLFREESYKTNVSLSLPSAASAGGLEAVTQLLQNLPPDTGMSFIYVQHLSPDHKSILTSILAKSTLMKVQEVTNRILMKPDNFYVIPPDKEMAVLNGHIKLMPRSKDRMRICRLTLFSCSLAEKHKESAIGIILSGSANDGTRGLRAIKRRRGTNVLPRMIRQSSTVCRNRPSHPAR